MTESDYLAVVFSFKWCFSLAHLKLLGTCLDGIGFIRNYVILDKLLLKSRYHGVHLLNLILQEHGCIGPEIKCEKHMKTFLHLLLKNIQIHMLITNCVWRVMCNVHFTCFFCFGLTYFFL